ncbi:MAG: DNA polymerase III subunit chi [Alphaproteobacteria bacterium]|nr:MAG: DNA polymerase III subunit chi [Alphaproteobacteria bacterium]
MTDISFYHLQRQPLERALPKLLERVVASSMKALVLADNEERVGMLNSTLWTYDQDSFLPHGSGKDGDAELQPIYLTVEEDNPNRANVLVLVDGGQHKDLAQFDRCLDMFDGNDQDAVAQARTRWKAYQDAGHEVTYWQQSDAGKWEKKA